MRSIDSPSVSSYFFAFVLTMILILMDMICNVLYSKLFIRKQFLKTMVVYIGQDICIILQILLFGYCLFRTNVFKAGFVNVLFTRFRSTLVIGIIYLMLTIGLQIATQFARHKAPLEYYWPAHVYFLFICQRLISIFYYYFHKRTILRLGDPRFYDEEWVKHTLVH